RGVDRTVDADLEAERRFVDVVAARLEARVAVTVVAAEARTDGVRPAGQGGVRVETTVDSGGHRLAGLILDEHAPGLAANALAGDGVSQRAVDVNGGARPGDGVDREARSRAHVDRRRRARRGSDERPNEPRSCPRIPRSSR